MPRTVDQGFEDFLEKLTPTSWESNAAQDHRKSIKTRLEQDFGYLKRFVRIGSVGNGTSISKYSDVDYLACFPTDKLTANSESTLRKVRESLDGRFPHTGVKVDCPAVGFSLGTKR
jgi:tRNA nucleotidyltransferase (CCA-adding enzyme)